MSTIRTNDFQSLDWNELDWSRGFIVTPIVQAYFPEQQSTRLKMFKISNILPTPHYLQSCDSHAEHMHKNFFKYLFLRIIITEEAEW